MAFHRLRAPIWIAVLICAACGLIGGWVYILRSSREQSKVAELFGAVRPVQGRLCQIDFAPYVMSQSNPISSARLRNALRQLQRYYRNRPGTTAVRDIAILSLLASHPLRASEMLEGTGENDARTLSDLSAVYIQRFQSESQDVQLLMRAITACSRALAKIPKLHEALFNKALGLELAGLERSSRLAWLEYLKQDTNSPWSEEARLHLRKLSNSRGLVWDTQRPLLAEAALTGKLQEVGKIVQEFPGSSRRFAEEELLENWGQYTLSGQSSLAYRNLRIARVIGEALANYEGDRLVIDIVVEIDDAQEKVNPQNLAQGFVFYQRGMMLFKSDDFKGAKSLFARSLGTLRRANSRFSYWPLLQLAICDYYASDYDSSIERLGNLRREASEDLYPIVVGRCLWIEGLVHSARSDFLEALSAHIAALALFQRANEVVNVGYVDSLIASDLASMGENSVAWKYRYAPLAVIGKIDDSRRVYSILQETAEATLGEGQLEAALSLFNELILRVDDKMPAGVLAEVLARRAAILGQMGESASAFEDLAMARQVLPRVIDYHFRCRIEADLEIAEARIGQTKNPLLSIALLTSAMAFYKKTGYQAETAQLLVLRAAIYREIGATEAARHDLDSGITEYETQIKKARGVILSAQYYSQVHKLYDARIELELETPNHVAGAFAYAERSRLRQFIDESPDGLSGSGGKLEELEKIQRSLPRRTVLIEYSVLPGRLLIWGLGSRTVFKVMPIQEKRLAALVESYRRVILSGDDAQSSSHQLYSYLIEPVRSLLTRDVREIVVVPDKFLQALPFSALMEPVENHFLVQDFSIINSSSSREFLFSQHLDPRVLRKDLSVLIVAGGDTHSRLLSRLPKLAAWNEGAGVIAGLYRKSLVLQGKDATRKSFLLNAPEHDVIHFSGHAVEEPSLDFSALLFSSSKSDDGVLRGSDLSQMRLTHTKVVVLGACRTALGGFPREGGISLAQSFLRAGAHTVVASLWDVNDRATTLLLTYFHKMLTNGFRPSEALRLAQAELLRSRDEALKKPVAWAGFESIGRDDNFQLY
jgi:CHAT domain-containing protein